MRWPAAALLPLLAACSAPGSPGTDETRYLYYLHGKIVEDMGPEGVSPKFGRYDYPAILAALRKPGLRVISEVRAKDTDPNAYAARVAAQIDAQLNSGVPPSHITVVGASKGSVIAALVSTRLQVAGIRYVLLADCNDWLIRTFDPHLAGEILSIYETSDDIGGSCEPLVKRSPGVTRFSEIKLETGLGHGIVYRPLPAWVTPTLAWATR